MVSIYLAYTPLHILTSCGFSLKMDDENIKILIIFKEFKDSNKYLTAIQNWEKNPFNEIFLFNGRYNFKDCSVYQKFRILLKKKKDIKKFWKKISKSKSIKINYFNDNTIESQYLLSQNNYINSENIYFDDGLPSYVLFSEKKLLRLLKTVGAKILFGNWYQKPRNLGLSINLQKMYSFYPEYALTILKKKYKKIEKIPSSIFDDLKRTKLIYKIYNEFNFSLELSNNKNAIILMPFTQDLKKYGISIDFIVNLIEELISILEKKKINIFLKYHPREPFFNYLKFKKQKSVLNPILPSELIFLSENCVNTNNTYILGPISTALITARIILGDNVNILTFYKDLYGKKFENFPNFTILIKKFNIKAINLKDEIFL
jgi:hypothetical protein